jgi:hypothetical protein
MTLFNDRERAYEAKYVHDLEMQFRALTLGVRMLAEWAATEMKLPLEDAQAYAQSMVSDFLQHHDEATLAEAVRADLLEAGIDLDAAALRARLTQLSAECLGRIGGMPPEDPSRRTRGARH